MLLFGIGDYSKLTDEEKKECQLLIKKLIEIQARMKEIESLTHPQYMRVNPSYLNNMMNSGIDFSFDLSSDGEHSIDVNGYSDLPVVFDESIDTYKYAFRR